MPKHNKPTTHDLHPSDLALEDHYILELVEKIQGLHNPKAQRVVREALESVLEFYGHAHHRHHRK